MSGERQSAAYRKAFDCNGKSEAAVRSDTSRLARNANIVKLIKMLQAQADSAAVMTRERRMALLSIQAEAEAKRCNWSGLIKIVDMLNKMDGTYESKKMEAELEKAAKEEERKKAATSGGPNTISALIHALQDEGCRPEVHPLTRDNPPSSPGMAINEGSSATQGSSEEGHPPEGW